MKKRFDIYYAGPLSPKTPVFESSISKVRRRILGTRGKYSYFSERTLDGNAQMVSGAVAPGSKAAVFRSAGRWCRWKPTTPYFIYLDAVVQTFVENTFAEDDFIQVDLDRIYAEEAAFLENATGVFFESAWGLERAVSAYNLKAAHYTVAGRGGVIDPPASDTWDGETIALVSIAMNFTQKGGDIVRDAFVKLKPRFPALTWNIIGGRPGAHTAAIPGVTYEGILDPDRPRDRVRMSSILSNAFLLVHPTREDTSPLVITEAAYYGCPSVSVNVFAIPELVVDGTTGLLVGSPPDSDAVAQAIESLLLDRSRYLSMRREARSYSLRQFSWAKTGQVICDSIAAAIGT
jgi:glycosyltransferase involved in cell wall biosynthesis